MSHKVFAFLLFVWFVGILLAVMMEGQYLGQQEVDVVNSLTGYTVSEIRGTGWLAIPSVVSGAFTKGLPKVLTWDFAFFQGEWQLLRWFLVLTLSAPTALMLGLAFVQAMMGVLSRFL